MWDSARVIWAMVALCGAAVGAFAFPAAARRVGRGLLRAALCMALAFGVNTLLRPLGWAVGLNAFTAVVTGVLGLPGLAALYVCKAMLA